jgi:hypothetical protein
MSPIEFILLCLTIAATVWSVSKRPLNFRFNSVLHSGNDRFADYFRRIQT